MTGRVVRENAVGSTGIHQQTPVRKLVVDVDKLAGGDGVDKTPDT